MVIERLKYYKLYFSAYVFCSVAAVLIYVYGLDTSIGFAILLNLPVVLLCISGIISYGRTFVLGKDGCEIRFWRFRKKYTWGELKTKTIETHDLPSMLRGRYSYPYLKEAMFAPFRIHKPKIIRAEMYSIFHPFSFIYINFATNVAGYQNGRYFEVDEAEFRRKMTEWGIQLEEK